MRVFATVVAAIAAALLSQPSVASEDAYQEAIRDYTTYVINLSAPVMAELCAPLVPAYTEKFETSYPKWTAANQSRITRGRAGVASRMAAGKTVEAAELLMVETTKREFVATDEATQLEQCTASLGILGGA